MCSSGRDAREPNVSPDWVETSAPPAPLEVSAPPDPAVPASEEALSGLPTPPSGVETHGERVPWGRLFLVVLAALSLLGQGERYQVDERFSSPSATLRTYWSALQKGDAEDVWECFVEGRNDLPMPGQLWFLPPVSQIRITAFRSLPVTRGRVLVSYEVRYVPVGFTDERSFRTGDELVRMRGAWRIVRPVGAGSLPEIRLPRRPVDI